MTRTTTLFSLLAIVTLALAGSANSPARPDSAARRAVLVELFTSEGCSDCPPADALLSKLEAQQPVPNAEVIGLEEHVDYWDQQGWRDPYSSALWTERQRDYASTFKTDSVYTPEMVVDGTTAFIGSRERQSLQSIAQAANNRKAEVDVSVLRTEKNKEAFTVRVGTLAGSSDGDTPEVWLAITETGLQMAVKSGENAGRELHHASVLRKLQKLGVADPNNNDASFAGQPVLSLGNQWARPNLRAVVFVQEKKTRRIIGAAVTKVGALNQ